MRHNNLISTGKTYNEPGYIESVPGLYDEPLRFTFSPMLPEERADHLDKSDAVRGSVKKQQLYAQLVSSRLTKWDLKDGHGDAVDIKPVNVLRLKPALFSRLYAIVLGVDPSDIDPEWSQEDKDATVQAEFESALTNKPVSEVLLEGSEKN